MVIITSTMPQWWWYGDHHCQNDDEMLIWWKKEMMVIITSALSQWWWYGDYHCHNDDDMMIITATMTMIWWSPSSWGELLPPPRPPPLPSPHWLPSTSLLPLVMMMIDRCKKSCWRPLYLTPHFSIISDKNIWRLSSAQFHFRCIFGYKLNTAYCAGKTNESVATQCIGWVCRWGEKHQSPTDGRPDKAILGVAWWL